MMKAAFLSIACILMLVASSCKKLDNTSAPVTANATVINSGPIAADGCGWLIRLNDSTEFSPVNLSAGFQQDNLKANIAYTQLSTRTSCGMLAGNPGIIQTRIDHLQKAN